MKLGSIFHVKVFLEHVSLFIDIWELIFKEKIEVTNLELCSLFLWIMKLIDLEIQVNFETGLIIYLIIDC